MSKKKIMVLVTSALLTLGVIGGTLATFTSKDEVTNKFQTIQDPNNKGEAGIDIWENFDKDKAKKAMPGVVVDKIVEVQNTAKYSQLIKVKITPTWVGKDVPKDSSGQTLDIKDALNMTFFDDIVDETTVKDKLSELKKINPKATTVDAIKNLGKHWIKAANEADTYYYAGRVSAGKFTTPLLKSVTLKSEVGNEYKNAKFDVRVDANSTLSNISYNDQWSILNDFTDANNYDEKDAGINSNDKNTNNTKATGAVIIGNDL